MRARSAVAALLLLGAALPTTAAASPGSFPSGSNAAELVRNFWDLVAQGDDDRRVARPKPQAIEQAPEGGPAVDLSDLSQPTALEARLKPALTPKSGAIRLTIPGGTARLGDYQRGLDRERRPGRCWWCRATPTSTADCSATWSRWTAT